MSTPAVQRASADQTLIVACVLATWLIWGSTYLAIKFALVSFPPFYQMGTRFLVAGLLLLGWLRWRGRALPTRHQWRNAAIIGSIMLFGGMGFTAYSEQSVASGLVVVFIAVCPILLTLFNLPFGVRPARIEVIGMLVGLAGVLFLMRGAAFTAAPQGLMAISIACVCWTLGSALSLHRFHLAPGAMGFASEMICGSVTLLLVSALVGEQPQWPPSPLAAWSWAYLVVFGSLLAFNAYMVLLARASAALASSYTYVNPLIALLLGVWLGNESVTLGEWWAAGVIVAGVLLLALGQRTRATA